MAETRKLVVMGRGGTGKTTFVALTARALIESGCTPLLLVDLDPDQNLGEMIGVDLADQGKQSISDLVGRTFLERGGTLSGISPTERMETQIWAEGMYEGPDFDFIAIGTKWVEGCYCLPDAAVKSALSTLSKQYRYVIIDSPAGLEHLNRKVTTVVDDIFDVMGPSKKSIDHVRRAYHLTRELGIRFRHFYTVGGYAFPRELEGTARSLEGTIFLGSLSYDPLIMDAVINGRSLLDIPADSAAARSVGQVLGRAGYL
jgi:CO dehydrogenase maturation factor